MNIIFYHIHQNGDCFTSRMFVNHFIQNTKHMNLKYFYTARSSLESHCEDIGIPKENFNVYDVDSSKMIYKNGNNLYINVWVGQSNLGGCLWCLNGWSDFYNVIIEKLKGYDIDIPPMNKTDQRFFLIQRDFEYEIDPKYEKIIVIYNCPIRTFQYMNYLNHSAYINELSNRHKNYLFVTFVNSGLNNENVVTFKDIFKGDLPIGYGIELAQFNTKADKVIFLPSGVSQMSFYNEKDIKNKYAILYDHTGPQFIPREFLPTHDHETNNLCIEKYGYHITKIWVDTIPDLESFVNQVDNFISN
jgi:hypothetical protein